MDDKGISDQTRVTPFEQSEHGRFYTRRQPKKFRGSPDLPAEFPAITL